MANGGPDSCAQCAHNRAVQQELPPFPEDGSDFRRESFCTLRQMAVQNPFWTSCANAVDAGMDPARLVGIRAKGEIQSIGLLDGSWYRIPWDGANELVRGQAAPCSICGGYAEQTVRVERADGAYSFCSTDHYLRWWDQQHRLGS